MEIAQTTSTLLRSKQNKESHSGLTRRRMTISRIPADRTEQRVSKIKHWKIFQNKISTPARFAIGCLRQPSGDSLTCQLRLDLPTTQHS